METSKENLYDDDGALRVNLVDRVNAQVVESSANVTTNTDDQ